jgi:LmbE family N-acetylglucosaminyl deacetylase
LTQLAGRRRRLDGPGTAEEAWQACGELRQVAPWIPSVPSSGRAVVVAPHPDDEILGVGGTVALLTAAGAEIFLVAVTDGEASHLGRQDELRRRRPQESVTAAHRLGISPSMTYRLAHPDGAIDEDRLSSELRELVQQGDLVLAPWWQDGHPDHDRVGRAALDTTRQQGADMLAYLVWTWHWAVPGADVPWSRACRVELGPEVALRKQAAAQGFSSQITGPDPILPSNVLLRLTRSFEILLRP